eukprot:COSAG06_NODE_59004_length_275_cov_0.886364_1_plen_58_part_10
MPGERIDTKGKMHATRSCCMRVLVLHARARAASNCVALCDALCWLERWGTASQMPPKL